MSNLLTNPQQIALLQQSQLGVEVEEHRITQAGRLSRAAHPANLGSRSFHPYFQSDFAETQAELVTDPHSSITALSNQLETLQIIFTQSLQPGELIWPLSLPPTVNKADLDFIATHFERPAKQKYRDYLLQKYGIQHEITTGAHVSFSLPQELLANKNIVQRNELYFHIVQNFILSRWLLTYLFGATPQATPNYFTALPAVLQQPVRSIRNSLYGFTNTASERIPYTSLAAHLNAINTAINAGDFYSTHEFYGPVRLKNQAQLSDYLDKGIDYLEFRIFDLDPFSCNGISQTTLRFFKVFLSYLAVKPLPTDLAAALTAAQLKNQQVACEVPQNSSAFTAEMQLWLQQLQKFSKSWPADYQKAVATIANRATHPELTPSAQIIQATTHRSLIDFARKQARAYQRQRWQYPLPEAVGLTIEQRELLIAAYRRGLRVKHDKNTILLCDNQQTEVLQALKLTGLSADAKLAQLFPNSTQKSS
ncbi:gamma-glutamylcysteine synthetase [Loigolactobacillus zhaoyuanensis]|uniref:Glutamate--cysteine ligase n=1 Tax=Loigolactobacillus zhaoyuanensis TaxID=2486017 RepID=A0ABW8UC48_9LACO|nr:gamma-glutamylcysteine synthetase [Loigolactobacillus zhaoyuanensis]